MAFPTTRLRRLRRTPALRRLVRETTLAPSDLVAPLFVRHGTDLVEEIPSLAGQRHYSIDRLVDEARALHELGVGGVLVFGIPSRKDDAASEAYDDEGIVQLAVRALRDGVPDL